MTISKKRILSGAQPTNMIHIGNYLGALKNWVALQNEYDCFFSIVDLHSITLRQDPDSLRESAYRLAATYIACGLDPKKCVLFCQSHVPQHAELGWVLTCYSTMGELNRMTQFKDKSKNQGSHIPAGLFVYPALMAADILLYQTDLVPVGEDQKQHLELTRDLAERTNNIFKKPLFKIPGIFMPPVGARIMSLQDPESKMSKSDQNPHAAVFLTDTQDVIVKKLKRAVTDSLPAITEETPSAGVTNLFTIQAALQGKTIEEIHKSYVGRQYGYLKVETAEILNQALSPIRENIEKLMQSKDHLESVLHLGRDKAIAVASKTLQNVYAELGFIR